jgi:hypothetical protein
MKKMIFIILFIIVLIQASDNRQKIKKNSEGVPQFPQVNNSRSQLFDIDKIEIIQAQLIRNSSEEKFIIYNGEKYVCVTNPTYDQSIATRIHETIAYTSKQKKLNTSGSSSSDEYWFPNKNNIEKKLKIDKFSPSGESCIQQ